MGGYLGLYAEPLHLEAQLPEPPGPGRVHAAQHVAKPGAEEEVEEPCEQRVPHPVDEALRAPLGHAGAYH